MKTKKNTAITYPSPKDAVASEQKTPKAISTAFGSVAR